jgi:UDP-N-acetylglucosamine pyrophosphorylase
VESFDSKLRDELFNSETFFTLKKAQIPVAQQRRPYHDLRPLSSSGRQSTRMRSAFASRAPRMAAFTS